MRAFLTGGTGFVGGAVARHLRDRGDDVVALVRSPSKAAALERLGCEVVAGDLNAVDAIRRGLEGCDAAIHSAAIYAVGVPRSKRPEMFDANVRGTERVLDAAIAARVRRIVHVSTINVYGNSHGTIRQDPALPARTTFLSTYDETKYLAHQVALARAREGAPVLLACPGAVYGPGDTSQLGAQLSQLAAGKLRVSSFPGLGLNLVHVDDVADGILRILDGGSTGEAYVLGGEITEFGSLLKTAAEIAGVRPPLMVPKALVRATVPLAALFGKVLGLPSNLAEVVKLSDGVTYWASDAKASRELGYAGRSLAEGLPGTLAATAGP